MTKLEVYRVKDTVSGKYLSMRSSDRISLTRIGRIYTKLHYLKDSVWSHKASIYRKLIHPELFPVANYKMHPYFYDENNHYQVNPEYYTQRSKEYDMIQEVKEWFPDTWIVVNTEDTQVCTLNSLFSDAK